MRKGKRTSNPLNPPLVKLGKVRSTTRFVRRANNDYSRLSLCERNGCESAVAMCENHTVFSAFAHRHSW